MCRPEIDQVADAGAGEYFPVGLADVALVAYHQRNDDTGIGLAGQRPLDAPAQPAAATLHDRCKAGNKGGQPPVRAARRRIAAHAAGGPQVLLQQPSLIVETVRVGIAMRPLEAQRELPAFARPQRRRLRAARLGIPGQRQPRRQAHGRVVGHGSCLHRQVETQAAFEAVRQAVDDACHHQVLPFQFGRQVPRQRPAGDQRRPQEPGQRAAGQAGRRARPRRAHARTQQHGAQRCGQQQAGQP